MRDLEIEGYYRREEKDQSSKAKESEVKLSKKVKPKKDHLIIRTLLKCHTAIMPYHAMEWATGYSVSLKPKKKK